MKSVEAYINELQPPEFYFSQRGTTRLIELAKQIQLDAMREGMRRAAEIADKTASENCMKVADESPWPHEAILSVAEQLTEKDL